MRCSSLVALVSASALAFVGLTISPVSATPLTPVTLNVNTTADLNGAPCTSSSTATPNPMSLRDAVCLANNLPTTDAVTINVPAGTYALTLGELDLGTTAGETVSVLGAGASTTAIDAGGLSRVFNIDMNSLGGVTASLQNLWIKDGADSSLGGAGILAGSVDAATPDSLSLSGVWVTDNVANATAQAQTNNPGGGLQFLGGQLSIADSVFSNNRSYSSPGAAIAYQAWGVGTESFSMTNTTINGNRSDNLATAGDVVDGAVVVSSPTSTSMSISGSTFTGNTANGTNGPTRGAALVLDGGSVSVSDSVFTSNTVTGAASHGGAIAVVTGTATVHRSRIAGNSSPSAAQGSGIALLGGGSISATDNWWGCNAGPGATGCDTTSGTVTTDPRIVLSGSPVTLLAGNTAPVSADLAHDSNGNALGGSLPAFDQETMGFSQGNLPGSSCWVGTAGVLPNNQTLSGGTAAGSCTFDPHGASGAGQVSVTVDSQTVNIPVTVNAPPTITSQPSNATVVAGANTNFTAAASGYPAPSAQWQVSTDGGVTFANIPGATGSTLSLTAVPASADQNQYRAVFSNGIGSPATSNAATLTVQSPPGFTSGATANFTVGTNSSFTITTSGNPPNSTISTASTLPSGLMLTSNGDGTATLSGTPTAGAGGSYTLNLAASNGINPNATQALAVIVSEAPQVTTNPSDVTTEPSTTATFTAAASGYPAPSVQWQVSTDSGATFTDIPGATSTTYQVTATSAVDGAQYRAVFSNGVGSPATTSPATLTVRQAPAIVSANSTTFIAGSVGTFTVTSTGYPAATLTETGTLPSGVTFSGGLGTATLSGTPAAGTGGSYPITFKADNGYGTAATQTFTLTVNVGPAVTSADNTTFTVGSAGSFMVTTAGIPAAGISETGVLPTGVILTDNGNGTATLAGTPAAGAGGTYPITITADNGVGSAATQSFTLTVDEAPSITSANAATFTADTAGSFTVMSAGFPAPTLTVVGSLPSGVTFVDNHDGTATLSGTPAVGTGGTYQFSILAGNGVGSGAAQTFTLTVDEAPGITSANTATFTVGSPGTFTVTTSGFPAGSLSESGALPGGVTFVDNGDGTATLSGTPTAGTGGSYPVTFTVHNGVGTDGAQDFSLKVDEAPMISSVNATTFTAGTAGTFTVATTGTPRAALSISASLPSGVSFTDNGDGTATIAGTPAAGSGGIYTFDIRADNGVTPVAVQSFTLTVDDAPAITSANTVSVGAAVAASPFTVTTSGFPVASLSESGALPGGVTFVDNGDGTATLTGTPAAGTAGSYPITITGTNGVGADATQDFTLVVTVAPQAIAFTSTPPTGAVVGQTYDVSATGGASGNVVAFTIDPSSTGVCSISASTVTFNHPGSCVVDAHQDGNGQYAPGDNSQTVTVGMASTATTVAVTAHTIVATVGVQSPGSGTPTGTVSFSVDGNPVGSASLASGVATLSFTVPNGATQHVAAVYGGSTDFSGSSGSTARQDPTIRARVTSRIAKSRFGWYRVPVTITFTCTTTSAPLTAPCPAPVTLSSNGAGRSVTRTVMATDGGVATVAINGINIDRTAPTVTITGVTNRANYLGVAPKAKCVAKDALSGVASCTLSSTSRSGTVTVTARATDKAGNVATTRRTYHVLRIFVLNATMKNGAYNLKQGQWFTIVALTSTKITPRYYDAVPFGQTPRPADNYFRLAGRQNGLYRYTIGVYLGTNLGRYQYWAFGVKIGKTMYHIKFHPLG